MAAILSTNGRLEATSDIAGGSTDAAAFLFWLRRFGGMMKRCSEMNGHGGAEAEM